MRVSWITYRRITKKEMTSLHTIDGNKVVLANYARDLIYKTLIKVDLNIRSHVLLSSLKTRILAQSMSKDRNMPVVAERFLSGMVKEYGKHPVSTDDGVSDTPKYVSF